MLTPVIIVIPVNNDNQAATMFRVTKSWLWTLLIVMTLWMTAVFYCYLKFSRDPGSFFYDKRHAFDRMYSAYRQREVEGFIQAQSQTGGLMRVGTDPKLCASFVSVKRDKEQYLPIALGSALHGLTFRERSELYVNILIAHVNLTTHPTTSLDWPSRVADRFTNYGPISQQQLKRLSQLEHERNIAEKSIFDYTHALETCYNDTKADWIVVFEDDIILADGWFIHVRKCLREMVSNGKMEAPRWLFIRLFNQERSIGWASRRPGSNHEALISLGIALPVAVLLAYVRRQTWIGRRIVDKASIGIICLFAIPLFTLLFFQAGKASMLPPKPGIHDDELLGCCSQGLVLPRDLVPRIVEYLNERRSGQVDDMLNDLASEDSLKRLALFPVQLQHIGSSHSFFFSSTISLTASGLHSSKKTDSQEAQAIWSMAFEYNNPRTLRREHEELEQLIYGDEPADDAMQGR